MAKQIPLTQNKYALVDDEDFERLSRHSWCFCGNGYAASRIENQFVLMHRFIMNAPLGIPVDHIDVNKLHNTKSNLRLCTTSQNQQNSKMHSDNRSGYKGVTWDKSRRKWSAQIKHNDKNVFVGRFDDAITAARAYDAAAKKYFGEFARLNFPQG